MSDYTISIRQVRTPMLITESQYAVYIWYVDRLAHIIFPVHDRIIVQFYYYISSWL